MDDGQKIFPLAKILQTKIFKMANITKFSCQLENSTSSKPLSLEMTETKLSAGFFQT